MHIDRRTFLRLAALTGMAVAAPAIPVPAHANEPFNGPFWVSIHADGGWDPTLLCDPKGRRTSESPNPVNTYLTDDIIQVGNFRVAPVEGNQAFFERHGSRLLVLNGVDTGTNSHDTGTRVVWSGGLEADMPALTALIAAASPPQSLPLGFVSNGGYDRTGDLVASTRIPSIDAIGEIIHPHRMDTNTPESLYLTPGTYDRVAQARQARLARQIDAATLPRQQRSMSVLMEARSGDNELAGLSRYLPQTLDNSDNPLRRQAQLACASFRAGLSVSANLVIGGFDTHGNHDQNHTPRLQRVVAGLDFLLEEAERQGIADRLFVVVGSDFARTPWYNDTRGKDHWSITSMMLLGPGIRGGRVIGTTDDGQRANPLDPNTLQPVASGGIRLTPQAIHASLRRLAGVADSAAARPFQVRGQPLPLFS